MGKIFTSTKSKTIIQSHSKWLDIYCLIPFKGHKENEPKLYYTISCDVDILKGLLRTFKISQNDVKGQTPKILQIHVTKKIS